MVGLKGSGNAQDPPRHDHGPRPGRRGRPRIGGSRRRARKRGRPWLGRPQPKSGASPRGKFDKAQATARLEPVEVRREYRISLGPWSTTTLAPRVDRPARPGRSSPGAGRDRWRSWESRSSCPRTAAPSRAGSSSGAWSCNGASRSLVLRVPAGVQCHARRPETRWRPMLDCALAGAEFVFGKALVDRRRPGRVRLRLPRPAHGDLRRGAVRGALSPGRDAVGRARVSPWSWPG